MTSSNTSIRDEIIQLLRLQERFAIVSHLRPDGDSIGSALALGLALENLGKAPLVVVKDSIPRAYSNLPGIEKVVSLDNLKGDFDAVILLDCTGFDRTGISGLDRYYSINIDHHPGEHGQTDLEWVDASAAAVGELVYDLAKELGQLTPEICENLYVAISTDTGSFQFSNTTERSFSIAAELVSHGASPGKIAEKVYLSQPYARIRLLAKVLETLQIHPSGQIAWISLSQPVLRDTGAQPGDTEGMVNLPLSITGVSLVAFFREEQPSEYRISLRSKDDRDVASVARALGGGGHKNAAGVSLKGSLKGVQSQVIGKLEELLHGELKSTVD